MKKQITVYTVYAKCVAYAGDEKVILKKWNELKQKFQFNAVELKHPIFEGVEDYMELERVGKPEFWTLSVINN